mmetsp:Transcript_17151/g.36840  ORF Transcript_17151/g.36840 Transcript_17151/m.36840 type:complete len:413 (-) Transcript_17151:63-1301(-)
MESADAPAAGIVASPTPNCELWGVCQNDGKEVHLLTLTHEETGSLLKVCTYGATLVDLCIPNNRGTLDDVLLGFDNLKAYEEHGTYLGCAVGRVCSRIANAEFVLDGVVHRLPKNNGEACHHGGPVGFNSYTWDIVESTLSSVKLRHVSPHKDQGFPGTLTVTVEYALLPTDSGAVVLSIMFSATTDRKTVVNLTNHAYFNLAGINRSMAASLNQHLVSIDSGVYIPTDQTCIPLGEFRDVSDSPFDFRTPAQIEARIEVEDEQLAIAQGFDHNFALRETPQAAPKADGVRGGTRALGLEINSEGKWTRIREADAKVSEETSGRTVELYTEEPCVHFYTGNYLGNDPVGKGGFPIPRRAAFCLETQHFTNSPNERHFPSVELAPGQTWESRTVFWFSRPSGSGGLMSACCCR